MQTKCQLRPTAINIIADAGFVKFKKTLLHHDDKNNTIVLKIRFLFILIAGIVVGLYIQLYFMENRPLPFYMKISSVLLMISLLLWLLFVGKTILVPLFIAAIICIFLIKPCTYLESKGMHHAIAAILCMLAAIFVIGAIIYFISEQLIDFKQDLPVLEEHFNTALGNLQGYIQTHFHVSSINLQTSVENLRAKVLNSAPALVGTTVSTVSTVIEYTVLVPIYTFLFLLYRNLIVRFLIACFKETHSQAVANILGKTKYVIRNYIFGLLIEMLIVAVLLFIGFMIIGAKYALLMAFLVALLNLIPYLGVLTAAILCLIITATSGNVVIMLGVLIVISIVHLIDSNILLPKVVGSKVKINALVTIVGVIIGNQIWGIPGMFLAVPMMAFLKVFFDGIDDLKPWGILLGEDISRPHKPRSLKIKMKKQMKPPAKQGD